MIHPTKRTILERLAAVCELVPEMRVGQLVAFLPAMAASETIPNLADMEDDDLLQALEQHYRDLLQWRASKETVA